MPQYSLVIDSVGSSVSVRSDRKQDIERIKTSSFLKRYIPSVVISNSVAKADCELIIKRGGAKIELQYPSVTYFNRKFAEKDVISLAEYLLERARQERGLYCIHGSACVLDGQAIIFWGNVSGLGKTSLCEKWQEKYGVLWLADEKIVIDFRTNEINGWVNVAYLKNDKKKFQQLQSAGFKKITIAFFVCPVLINDSCLDLIFDKWPAEKLKWHLFEETNRKIRATSRMFFSGMEPIMPLDTPDLARKRIRAINKIIKHSKGYLIKGCSDSIYKKVIHILKK